MSLSGKGKQVTVKIEVPQTLQEAAQLLLIAALHGTEEEIEEYLLRYRLALGTAHRAHLSEIASDMGISAKTLWTRRNKWDSPERTRGGVYG